MSPDKLELAKIPNREINFLLEEEVQQIMNAPFESAEFRVQNPAVQAGDTAGNNLKLKRDVAILWMLYGTGLRVSELVSLKIDQINADSKQFSVMGKGSKIRAIFMTNKAREALVEYLKARSDESEYLFISLSGNSFGNALSRNSIESIVKKYKTIA